jgi:hypothetical protein
MYHIAPLSLATALLFAIGTGHPSNATDAVSPADWSGIRAAYDASRHAAIPQPDGSLAARNPGQHWQTRFDGRGFTIIPNGGEWTWGLELRRCGFEQTPALTESPAVGSRQAGHVHYDWSSDLHEWFINDARGLQQGWTIRKRPEGAAENETLRLEFTLRGELQPVITPDGTGISLHQSDGAHTLDFSGLKAWDADGHPLKARFETRPGDLNSLQITVDEQGARYPITIDPIAQIAYFKAGYTGAEDKFGSAVAVFGSTVVIGAPNEDSSATSINGDQSNNGKAESGAAYVFVREAGAWTQQAYLKATNSGASDTFGSSVAICDNTIVVGAPGEASGDDGVNGNGNDNSAPEAGAAYVFQRSGTSWSQQAYLKASNPDSMDRFGHAVAVSGDTIVVGAEQEDSADTDVDGDQSDNSAPNAGAAYVFTRSDSSWTQQAYLKASNSGGDDRFGCSVAVAGDVAVVGARLEDSNATGIDGDESNNSAADSGAAYVFSRSNATWTQQAYLKASNTGSTDHFGCSVGVSKYLAIHRVVVGAEQEDGSATGINGTSNNGSTNAGAAYIFDRVGVVWNQRAYVKPSNTGSGDNFGHSVAVSGDTVVVGAPKEDSNSTTIDGDGADNSALSSGAVYAFRVDGAAWSQIAYLKASNADPYDLFGSAVAISDDRLAVGAPDEDSNATGPAGDPSDNSAIHAGASYLFGLGRPEIAFELPDGTDVHSGDTVDFGEVPVGVIEIIVLTIHSHGSTVVSTRNASFEHGPEVGFLTTPPPHLVGSTPLPFQVHFVGNSAGTYTTRFTLENDDPDENPYEIFFTGVKVGPDIAVEDESGTDIPAGTSTHVGTVVEGSHNVTTLTIRNAGPANLTLGSPAVHSGHTGDFLLYILDLPSILSPGATATFTATFTPQAAGTRSAVIRIPSDDPDEDPFDFTIEGIGEHPDITVEDSASQSLANGATVNFGTETQGDSTMLSFTVRNDASFTLALGTPGLTGSHTADYSLDVSGLPANLGAGESGTITVTFAPQANGSRNANLIIPSNDPDENPFQLSLTGTGEGDPGPGQPPPAEITLHKDGSGQITAVDLVFYAAPFESHEIQRSENLVTWEPVGTIEANINGKIIISDILPPSSKAFYRLKP